MLFIEVYLDGSFVGRGELSKRSGLLGPMTIRDEVRAIIATICFLRDDDLLSSHSYEDFTIKGVYVRDDDDYNRRFKNTRL